MCPQQSGVGCSFRAFSAQPADRLATGVRRALSDVGTKLRLLTAADSGVELAVSHSGRCSIAALVAERRRVDFTDGPEGGGRVGYRAVAAGVRTKGGAWPEAGLLAYEPGKPNDPGLVGAVGGGGCRGRP